MCLLLNRIYWKADFWRILNVFVCFLFFIEWNTKYSVWWIQLCAWLEVIEQGFTIWLDNLYSRICNSRLQYAVAVEMLYDEIYTFLNQPFWLTQKDHKYLIKIQMVTFVKIRHKYWIQVGPTEKYWLCDHYLVSESTLLLFVLEWNINVGIPDPSHFYILLFLHQMIKENKIILNWTVKIICDTTFIII